MLVRYYPFFLKNLKEVYFNMQADGLPQVQIEDIGKPN